MKGAARSFTPAQPGRVYSLDDVVCCATSRMANLGGSREEQEVGIAAFHSASCSRHLFLSSAQVVLSQSSIQLDVVALSTSSVIAATLSYQSFSPSLVHSVVVSGHRCLGKSSGKAGSWVRPNVNFASASASTITST